MTNKITRKTLAESVGECLLKVMSASDSRRSSDRALSQLLIGAIAEKSVLLIIAPGEDSITIYAVNSDRERSTFAIEKIRFHTIWTQIFLRAEFNIAELRLHQTGVITIGDHNWSVATMPTILGSCFILRPDIITRPELTLNAPAAGIYISLVGDESVAAGAYDFDLGFPVFIAREHYKYHQSTTISIQLKARLGLTAGVAAEFIHKFAKLGIVTDIPSKREDWARLTDAASKTAIVIDIRQKSVARSLTAIEESGLLASELAPHLRGIFVPVNGKMKLNLIDEGIAKLISQSTSFAGLSQIIKSLLV